MAFPDCPISLKPIQHYLKTAAEHDSRDIIVSYWCRLYALQTGLKLSKQQPDESKLLISLMDWLEQTKKANAENESIMNDVAGQAHLENYALKLFMYADKQDRESNFGKNVVKAFYTAGIIYDTLLTFGELTDEAQQNRKYAKLKAAYIHNCLKNGETPIAGPFQKDEDDEGNVHEEEGAIGGFAPAPAPTPNSAPTPEPINPGMGFSFPAAPQNYDSGPSPINNIAARLPSPPAEPEKPPGGFQAYDPTNAVYNTNPYDLPSADVDLSPDQIAKAAKYCKWAGSALNYDDVKTAIENLQKGLRLLQTGEDS